MRRLLACLWYHFASQRILVWIAGIGVVIIAFGLFLPGSPLIALGSVFLAFFPILVGGLSYRQLIANRRIAMVPDIRYFATGALFLLAAGGAALAYLATTAAETSQDAARVGLLAFSGFSLYLVLSQWLFTRPQGFAFFGILPLVLLRLATANDPVFGARLLPPGHWLAIAGLGWLWLAIAVCGRDLPRGLSAAARTGAGSAGAAGGADRNAVPHPPDRIATAPGTLMRGLGDAWRNRAWGALVAVLMMPVVMNVLFAVLNLPFRETEARRFAGEFFLAMSFFGICMFPAMHCGEWPVRLRLIWLRVAGDRAALWRLLERSLLQEQMLIFAAASLVGLGFLLWSEVPREFVYFYVASSLLAALVGGYLGFWVRASGWSTVVQGLLLSVILLSTLVGGLRLRASGDLQQGYWLLPALGLLALVFRTLARWRFRRMDWCQVRPRRFPRRAP